MTKRRRGRRSRCARLGQRCFIIGLATALLPTTAALAIDPLDTTIDNFFMRGSQPDDPLNPQREPITTSFSCISCHAGFDAETGPIYSDWSGSLMANAARDPIFLACLEIAEADAPGSGDICIRCHVPKAWLEGRSDPTDGSAINSDDRDGVTCNFCHRLVDPFQKETPPAVDAQILIDLGSDAPIQSTDGLGRDGDSHGANYVIDPLDRRRGPFPVTPAGDTPTGNEANCDFFHQGLTSQPTFESPLHRRADICSTCHDVSTPHFAWDGSAFVYNEMGNAHPTGNKYEMVPIERTYSEWLQSDFANGGVDMGGRFGGPGQTVVSSCQDCHMPRTTAEGCNFEPARPDLPHHFFHGAATWQLDAILDVYADEINTLQSEAMMANKLRNIAMLENAATLELTVDDSQTPGTDQLRVRVTNETGHKLPSGYGEGRRIWVSVQFFDCTGSSTPIAEHGHYDFDTAELTTGDTKVYEYETGADGALASLTGLPAGAHFHFVLANTVIKDNRIPPRGFTNANFAAVQAAPVAYSYADGQFWDDTYFSIPGFAASAKVQLYYQATSKEYIEFLRDNNPNPSPNAGTLVYDLWETYGMSSPVLMAEVGDATPFDVNVPGDVNGDRSVTIGDLPLFVDVLIDVETDPQRICRADMDGVDGPNGLDIDLFIQAVLP